MTETMVTHIDGAALGTGTPKRRKWRLRNLLMLRPQAKAAIAFGLMSAALYYGLYYFNDDIRHVAEMTNRGDRTFFLLPIALAFVFSIVHGIFTDRFWDALGLKAKR
ncbi:hypothetical protein V5T82_04945 [Magnetovibrio sp. PR-2]|uniref:hypothetical protein n=1 Tax=Magnetovibrio sp. PR-2 TaxID=3120356 RepID=UPI002FCE5032